jgi:iron complex transport system permease protein
MTQDGFKFNRISYESYYVALTIFLLAVFVTAAASGAVHLSVGQIWGFILHKLGMTDSRGINPVQEGVFFQIRLPRVLMCVVAGAGLSVSGALMQALFRNPIVEPGLIGTSSGAAFGAAFIFVVGKDIGFLSDTPLGGFVLPITAFACGFASTTLVYRVSTVQGKATVATMLLAGIAVNAIAAGGTGFMSYIARDPQARSITFWNLGTFSGADWRSFWIAAPVTVLTIVLTLRSSKGLNALLLGEEEAGYLGVRTETLKRRIIFLNCLVVGVVTSIVGVIVFVGLVVPHILRMLRGSDNRFLIIGSSLLGPIVMLLADMFARLVIAPAEMPIGIVTAFVGAPVFLYILLRKEKPGRSGGFYA